MAKKQTTKATWGWVIGKAPAPKLSASDKIRIEAQFADLVKRLGEEYCKEETPEKDAQGLAYPISIYTKWYRNFLSICINCRNPHENAIAPYYEYKLARIEVVGKDAFKLAYFRHTGEWFTLPIDHNLETAIQSIETDPWFEMY